jgi:hypothetical protein
MAEGRTPEEIIGPDDDDDGKSIRGCWLLLL